VQVLAHVVVEARGHLHRGGAANGDAAAILVARRYDELGLRPEQQGSTGAHRQVGDREAREAAAVGNLAEADELASGVA
jgi:hypothetical protein